MEYETFVIDAWKHGENIYWRDLSPEERSHMHIFTRYQERYWFPGKAAAVVVVVCYGSEPLGREGALACAASKVNHTGTPHNLDLRF